jgi:hypothetical protein
VISNRGSDVWEAIYDEEAQNMWHTNLSYECSVPTDTFVAYVWASKNLFIKDLNMTLENEFGSSEQAQALRLTCVETYETPKAVGSVQIVEMKGMKDRITSEWVNALGCAQRSASGSSSVNNLTPHGLNKFFGQTSLFGQLFDVALPIDHR